MKKSHLLLAFSSLLLSNICSAQTWNVVPSGTSKDLFEISFPSSSVGYIVGADSLILKTIDAGNTWSPLDMTGFPFVANAYDIVDVKFVTDDIGFITVGPYTGSYKTIDGGASWTLINSINACYNKGLYFFDENNGFLGGSGCFSGEIINKLTNGIWDQTNISAVFNQSYGIINNFDFWDDSLGLATSTAGYFFRTTNGGSIWDTVPNTLDPTDSLTSVLFVSKDTVLATFRHSTNSGFGVLISFDSGLTWQPEMNSATFFYPHMDASERSGNDRIYIGGMNSFGPGLNPGLIYESTGPINAWWNYESVAERINGIDSYGDSIVFAVGENGYIVVNQDVSILSISELDSEEILISPNPNSGEFIIETGQFEITKIQIVDMNGSLVHSNVIHNTGQNEVKVSGLVPGIYQVHLSAGSKSFIQKVVIF